MSYDAERPTTPDSEPSAEPVAAVHRDPGTRPLIILLSFLGVVHAHLASRLNINWDEFYYLALVYDHARGALSLPLQTIHVQLFSWLPWVTGHEVDQVLVGRAVYVLLLLVSGFLTYRVSRHFLDVEGSLFAVLAFGLYGNVLLHGTSFRADALAVCLLLGSLALVLRRDASIPPLVVSAALLALALLVTIKSALYIPTIGAALLLRQRDESHRLLGGPVLRQAAVFGGALILVFIVLYLLHQATLASTAQRSVLYVQAAAAKVIRGDRFLPARAYLVRTILTNLVFWVLLFYGLILLIRRVWVGHARRQAVVALALALPLLSPVFYRNAFPYFYVMLVPLGAVLCGVAFEHLFARSPREPRLGRDTRWVVAVGVALPLLSLYVHGVVDGTRSQRQLLDVVHELFPAPVPYIDRNSMVASFPKVGFFMSTWGMESYRQAGIPVFEELLRLHSPPLLIANGPALQLAMREVAGDQVSSVLELLPQDAKVLRDNYVQHWGPVYVAGKRIQFLGGRPRAMHILITGDYTVEASADGVVIDGSKRSPGDVVRLERGTHLVAPDGTSHEVTLRWGARLIHPTVAPRGEPLYVGF